MDKPVFELYNDTTEKWTKIYENGRIETTDRIGMVINRLPELLLQKACQTVEDVYNAKENKWKS